MNVPLSTEADVVPPMHFQQRFFADTDFFLALGAHFLFLLAPCASLSPAGTHRRFQSVFSLAAPKGDAETESE